MTFADQKSWFGMRGLTAMLIVTAGLANAQFLRVRVTMENGDPPPSSVDIEEFCMDGKATKIGITNAEGYFFRGVGLISDVGEGGPDDIKTTLNGYTCQLRAILPGYISSVATPPRFNPMYSPNKGVIPITLHKADQTEGNLVSATSLLAPKGARNAFEQGMKAMEDGNLEGAEKSLKEAVKLYDRYAEAWYQLGKVYRKMLKPKQAREALDKSITADPRYVDPYEDLSQLAFERDDMEELLDKTETLLRLNPYEFPQAYYYNAVANLQLKHYEAGEERIREAIEYDPNYEQPKEYYVLGFLLSGEGRLAEALGALEIYLALQPDGDSADQARGAMKKLRKRLEKRLQQPILMPTKRWTPPKPVRSAPPEAPDSDTANPEPAVR